MPTSLLTNPTRGAAVSRPKVLKSSFVPLTENELSLLPPSKRVLSDKKRNGVFYTPNQAAQLLTEWGIHAATDTVLEPSFGGCGFLEAAVSRLKHLGTFQPEEQLFGCDVDPAAFEFLANLFDDAPTKSHFKRQDFLTISLSDFSSEGVDVVIGNPPYVSWHNMLPNQRESASQIKTPAGISMNRKGSLWTFFVAHSLNFLNCGGRMAWILPGSFMHADYARPLRESISSQFSRTLAILLEQRIFLDAGTEENSIILLCEGYQQSTGQAMRFSSVQGLSELENVLNSWNQNLLLGSEWNQEASRLLAPPSAIKVYDKLLTTPATTHLSYLIKARIGLVTGDNKFFVLDRLKAEKLELPKRMLLPIIARQEHFRGLQVTEQDLGRLAENKRCLLLNTNPLKQGRQSRMLSAYLNSYSAKGIEDNRTFAKRQPWHQISLESIPDAFFSCMNWYGPALAVNLTQTTCTNSVYRIDFKNHLFANPDTRYLIAICLQSTFSQLSAELVGRSCGSGALKLEPSDVARIAILFPESVADNSTVFAEIDTLLREGQIAKARYAADNFLIEQNLLTRTDVNALEEGLLAMRKLRQGDRCPINQ